MYNIIVLPSVITISSADTWTPSSYIFILGVAAARVFTTLAPPPPRCRARAAVRSLRSARDPNTTQARLGGGRSVFKSGLIKNHRARTTTTDAVLRVERGPRSSWSANEPAVVVLKCDVHEVSHEGLTVATSPVITEITGVFFFFVKTHEAKDHK